METIETETIEPVETPEEQLSEQYNILINSLVNITELDETSGTILTKFIRMAMGVIEDEVNGTESNYFEIFESLVGKSVYELVAEASKQSDYEVDEEILDFITDSDNEDAEEYKKKVSEFQALMSEQ